MKAIALKSFQNGAEVARVGQELNVTEDRFCELLANGLIKAAKPSPPEKAPSAPAAEVPPPAEPPPATSGETSTPPPEALAAKTPGKPGRKPQK